MMRQRASRHSLLPSPTNLSSPPQNALFRHQNSLFDNPRNLYDCERNIRQCSGFDEEWALRHMLKCDEVSQEPTTIGLAGLKFHISWVFLLVFYSAWEPIGLITPDTFWGAGDGLSYEIPFMH